MIDAKKRNREWKDGDRGIIEVEMPFASSLFLIVSGFVSWTSNKEIENNIPTALNSASNAWTNDSYSQSHLFHTRSHERKSRMYLNLSIPCSTYPWSTPHFNFKLHVAPKNWIRITKKKQNIKTIRENYIQFAQPYESRYHHRAYELRAYTYEYEYYIWTCISHRPKSTQKTSHSYVILSATRSLVHRPREQKNKEHEQTHFEASEQ